MPFELKFGRVSWFEAHGEILRAVQHPDLIREGPYLTLGDMVDLLG